MTENDSSHEADQPVIDSHRRDIASARRLASIMLDDLEKDVLSGGDRYKAWGGKETVVSAFVKLSQILIKSIAMEREVLGLDKLDNTRLEDEDEDDDFGPEDDDILRIYEEKKLQENQEQT